MDKTIYKACLEVMRAELVRALGCTEPGAVAFAAGQAASLLGEFPDHLDVWCSGNIVKNVKGVIVPNSGGMRGIDAAAVLGALCARADKELEILTAVTPADIEKAKQLLPTDYCKCMLEEGEGNLYIRVVATKGKDSSEVILRDGHTNITYMRQGDKVLVDKSTSEEKDPITEYKKLLSIKNIIDFANNVEIADVKDMLDVAIKENCAIAEEGLKNDYGASVGKTILESYGDDVRTRARAKAAAGSDARMAGSSMPVVINSGSGNQGITVTVPVVEFAKELNLTDEERYRALCVSNLVGVAIKRHIGKLSAFCGAISASTAVGAAITYMRGGSYEEICYTITNTLANVGGVVCDGAKASCAAKIAAGLEAAMLADRMAAKKRHFEAGEGLVEEDIEKTIANIGAMGRVGMASTDVEILHLMLGDVDPLAQ